MDTQNMQEEVLFITFNIQWKPLRFLPLIDEGPPHLKGTFLMQKKGGPTGGVPLMFC